MLCAYAHRSLYHCPLTLIKPYFAPSLSYFLDEGLATTPGLDGTHTYVLMVCSANLSKPLYQQSDPLLLALPRDWKTANVTPIYKKSEVLQIIIIIIGLLALPVNKLVAKVLESLMR